MLAVNVQRVFSSNIGCFSTNEWLSEGIKTRQSNAYVQEYIADMYAVATAGSGPDHWSAHVHALASYVPGRYILTHGRDKR